MRRPSGSASLRRVAIVGPGRAGLSLQRALCGVDDVEIGVWGRHDDLTEVASGTDLVVIATPDEALGPVARSIRPAPDTVVAHLSGVAGLDVLAPHERRASLHPLVTLPTPALGARRLTGGATFVTAGDPLVLVLVELLGGHTLQLPESDRVVYHAAACVAANHLVALLGQVERLAGSIGLPLACFLPLVRGAVEDCELLGPAGALTGPASRGDEETIAAHRAAMDPREVDSYDAGVELARRLRSERDAAGGPEGAPGLWQQRRPEREVEEVRPAAMRVVRSRDEFSQAMRRARWRRGSVALVPTMGALHSGHRSLIAAGRQHASTVAVSIFVNPAQFGDEEDLRAYPRDLESDFEVARDAGVDLCFSPSVLEIYPDGGPKMLLDPGPAAGIFEGRARPGHFAGVATVVAKLLFLAGRCTAVFGEKDYQQLVIVRELVKELLLPVEVLACPTVREPDGLALSSRNVRLSPVERAAAPVLYRGLLAGGRLIAAGERDRETVLGAITATVADQPLVDLDYVGMVEEGTLRIPDAVPEVSRLLIAGRVGPVRLIDNLLCTARRVGSGCGG